MRRTQGEWARIVARYRKSGWTARHFSADEGVSEQSLRNWTRKFDGPISNPAKSDTGFVEIGGTAHSGPLAREVVTIVGDGLVIRFESGVHLEVGPRTDRELLSWVLTFLRHAS